MTIRFDASLPVLVKVMTDCFGGDILSSAAVIRDASGRLSVVLAESASPTILKDAEDKIRQRLDGYARPDLVIRDAEAIGARRLLEEAARVAPLTVGGVPVHLLDRRFVGPDWLRPPTPTTTGIPRIVFASLKGGVGRTTALSVVAAHLSRLGRRVLAVDFDLEAPGLGSMLLNETELPPYGTLDYLVENGLSGVDNKFMADVKGGSFLGAEGAAVTVVPAIGKATFDNPGDALSKISRAYMEQLMPDGSVATLRDQFCAMIEHFEATEDYDVVLVDARAGLHETTPAAIMGLGAEVLLFGVDQPQTFLGYRLLLAHLSRFPADHKDDWRSRLNFVHAKASDNEGALAQARERFSTLYELIIPPIQSGETAIEPLTEEDFDVEWADCSDDNIDYEEPFSSPPVLYVLDDSRYRDFDPIADRSLMASQTCAVTFGSLLAFAERTAIDAEVVKP